MKLTGDFEGFTESIRQGALQGAAVGFCVSAGLATYLRRRTNFFKTAGGYQKVFVYAVPAAFCTIVNMEFTSRKFEEAELAKKIGTDQPVVAAEKSTPNAVGKVTNWLGENKYGVIVSGWAASMLGSFWLVNRDKYMTKSQKIVQARVYAQGLTVAMLIGSVLLSVTSEQSAKDAAKQKAEIQSRSWERDIKFVETANHSRNMSAKQKQEVESDADLAAADRQAGNKSVESQVKTTTRHPSNSSN